MITLDKAIETVKECVAERGEGYIYPRHYTNQAARESKTDGACRYWWGQEELLAGEGDEHLPEGPGCIVGLALTKLGWPADRLQGMDRYGTIGSCVTHGSVSQTDMTDEAMAFFSHVQAVQDDHRSWGNALESALSALAAGHLR